MEEGGDVDVRHRASVLGTQGDRVVDGDGELASVPGDVVVDPEFQSLEQGGLAVVPAADDEGDPAGHAETGEAASRG